MSGLIAASLIAALLLTGCAPEASTTDPSATPTPSETVAPPTSEPEATESYTLPSGEKVTFSKDNVPDAVIQSVAEKAGQYDVSEGLPYEKLDVLHGTLEGTKTVAIYSSQGLTRADATNPNAQPRTLYTVAPMDKGGAEGAFYSFEEAHALATQIANDIGGKVVVVDN